MRLADVHGLVRSVIAAGLVLAALTGTRRLPLEDDSFGCAGCRHDDWHCGRTPCRGAPEFPACDRLLAADALQPRSRKLYTAAWHGFGLALMIEVSLIA